MPRMAIAVGSIMTLVVVMQVTGRLRWQDRLAPPGVKRRLRAVTG